MPVAQIIVVVLFIGLVTGLLFYFFQQNKKIAANHVQQQYALQAEIALHTSQVNFRSKSLDKYHFLMYNLEEALVVQPEVLVF
ncbi:MAG: hypothetical protein K8F54_12170 [Altibacter sp.]|uniref:hypothetical protein n=1 Tax=Altibacter sp. TaxID=2024823 RepID=UPI001D63E405|nr:hypothetical protein [Altibacter sp.]MBZ0328357.1 hypothetical protein [Altibacter sp.]